MANHTEYGRYRSAEGEYPKYRGIGHSDQPEDDRCQPDADEDLPSPTKARGNFRCHRIEQLGDLELRVEQVGVHLVC